MDLKAQPDLHVSMELKPLLLLRINFTISTLQRTIESSRLERNTTRRKREIHVTFGSENFNERHERDSAMDGYGMNTVSRLNVQDANWIKLPPAGVHGY